MFARDTAEVMTGAGLRPTCSPARCRRRVLAFAIRDLGCVAGVMVTASHNPPQDNGYKVYLGDGSQIVPPADAEIAAQIAAVGAGRATSRAATAVEVLGDELLDRYLDDVVALAGGGPRDLAIVYTPLHGVGGIPVATALKLAGFAEPHVATAQAEPDPDFPTVAFPNPEEPGAMDLAMALAEEVDADLVVANDPDADRCAVAVPGPARLADAPRRRGRRAARRAPAPAAPRGRLRHLDRVLQSCSARWRSPRSSCTPRRSPASSGSAGCQHLAFGYEEALGYCVDPAHVKDKDGVSALLMVCDIAARAKAAGRTLRDLLDDLARTYGLHATDQLSVRMDDLAAIPAVVDRLRDHPPTSLGGLAVEQVDDLSLGLRARAADHRSALPAGRRRPGRRTPLGHGAEAQVLPRGRRAGRGRGRTASTPPASPRSAASTPSGATSQAAAGL